MYSPSLSNKFGDFDEYFNGENILWVLFFDEYQLGTADEYKNFGQTEY